MNKKIAFLLLAGTISALPAAARLTLEQARERGAVADPMLRALPGGDAPATITPGSRTKGMKAAKRRLSAKGSAVYGYLGYADEYRFEPAMCELDGEAFGRIWTDPRYYTDDAIMNTGWLRDGRLCGVANISFMGMTLARYNVECDLASGQAYLFEEIDDNVSSFSIAALDKSDDTLYGIIFRDGKYFFGKAPGAAPTDITEICEAPERLHLISMTYRDDDKSIYAVNMAGELLKVAHDGSVSLVKNLPVPETIAGYYTGLVYVPADRQFIWNVNYSDYSTSLFSIDAESYEMREIERCPNDEQYMFMVCPDGAFDPSAPARPSLASIDFPRGALAGSVSFTLPSELQDGKPISGEISYTITVDGEDHASGKAQPGAVVKADFEWLSQGFHTFGIRAEADGHTAPMQLASAYLGQDVPSAPRNVKLTADRVSWDPVTTGVNGGYVDAEAIRYHVSLDGDEIGDTSETSMAVQLPVDEPVAPYRLSVTAEYDNIWSAEGWSNFVVVGKPLEMPVDLMPTEGQYMTFSYADGNDSGNVWRYDSGDASIKMLSNGKEADAWIFTPLINFPATDRFYTLAFNARSLSSKLDGELLSVYIGPKADPEAMKPAGDVFSPSQSGYETYERLLSVDAPGDYVIGFRCTSPEVTYGVGIADITVTDDGVTPDSPGRALALNATPAAGGELKARVDFTFPSNDVMGNPLPADVKMKAVVSGENKVVANGRPGEKAYANVNTKQGNNRLSVVVSIDGKNSPAAYVNAYTGVVRPAPVQTMIFLPDDDMMGVSFMWTPVTTGVNDGYVDPDEITYTLFRYVSTPYSSQWVPVLEGISGNQCNYRLPDDEPQAMMRFGVCGVNAAGRGDELAVVSLVAGKTYDLPMVENFAEATEEGSKYDPYVNYHVNDDYTLQFMFVSPEELGSEYADQEGFYFATGGPSGAKARVGLPCFNTLDGGAEIELTALCGNEFGPLSVYVDCGNYNAPKYVGTMPSEGGLVSRKFPLPSDVNFQGWVQVLIDGTIVDNGMLAIRGYSILPVGAGVDAAGIGSLQVTGGKGEITVAGADGEEISVIGISGIRVASVEEASDAETFRLPAGIYMVKAGGKCVKTVVK